MEEQQLHKRLLCGGVHRDSEHRIVSATIPIHAACGRGLTQGTPLFTLLREKIQDWRIKKIEQKER